MCRRLSNASLVQSEHTRQVLELQSVISVTRVHSMSMKVATRATRVYLVPLVRQQPKPVLLIARHVGRKRMQQIPDSLNVPHVLPGKRR